VQGGRGRIQLPQVKSQATQLGKILSLRSWASVVLLDSVGLNSLLGVLSPHFSIVIHKTGARWDLPCLAWLFP
jgi:hypothetical protein